jgi:hypothetical protein
MTSEKMNQLMLHRYDASTFFPYIPPSDSEIESPNQCHSVKSSQSSPKTNVNGAHDSPLTHDASDTIAINRPVAAMIGCFEGCGTK